MPNSQHRGVIYILTNPSFENYVKIGYASNIERRLRELNRSEAIPFAFRVYATYSVDGALTDKELHKLIDALNPDLRAIEKFDGRERVKEFYAMSAEEAYNLLECIAKISGTQERLKRMKPEGHEILDEQLAEEVRESSRRGPFKFSDCNIPVGSIIEYIEDTSIQAVVVDDRRIEYNQETTSLSALARKLKGCDHPVPGPMWFQYQGEKLADIRNRFRK